MKQFLFTFLILLKTVLVFSQTGNPANFAIDGNASANNPTTGIDDWFNYIAASGLSVIDTNGAAVIRQNLNAGHFPFSKRMAFNNYTVLNGSLFLDGLFARDYHTGSGTDRTVMLGSSSKNCANPMTEWRGGAGGIGGSANDLIDIYAHARRSGTSISNDLWVYGGIAYNTPGGAHYFDYEFYQAPINFIEPASSSVPFLNSGADEGHTAWRFDAGGNVIKAGDLIVAIGYGNGGLSSVEIRIWVSKNNYQNITPAMFNWGGDFDQIHNSRTYGYARIQIPVAAMNFAINNGSANIACGPWGFPASGTVINNYYSQYQLFEFALNFSALGIDPRQIPGQDPCSAPFSKLLVKSRVGNGFNADLKDFAGPYGFLNLPQVTVNIGPDRSLCLGRDTLLLNANASTNFGSFHWSSLYGDGIISNPDSSAVYINLPGIYFLESYLYNGCSVSHRDTIIISNAPPCLVLPQKEIVLSGINKNNRNMLSWQLPPNGDVNYFVVERSTGGAAFTYLASVKSENKQLHQFTDDVHGNECAYRVKAVYQNGMHSTYSNISRILNKAGGLHVYKKPGKDILVIDATEKNVPYKIDIYNLFGAKVFTLQLPGTLYAEMPLPKKLPGGIYYYKIFCQQANSTGNLYWD
ncbi:MAG: hypothetical protein WAT19_09580 [Ferruginibacter sp.]